jgi:hypothetical protein
MAIQTISLTGKIMWPKHLFVYDDGFNNEYYKAQIIPDEESMGKFKASGIRTKVTEVKESGEPLLTLKRNNKSFTFESGDSIGGGAPSVVDKEGNVWPEKVGIGNGSVVELTVEVYDTRNGKGHRLEQVRVLDYIPYNNERREQDEEPSAVKATTGVKEGRPW